MGLIDNFLMPIQPSDVLSFTQAMQKEFPNSEFIIETRNGKSYIYSITQMYTLDIVDVLSMDIISLSYIQSFYKKFAETSQGLECSANYISLFFMLLYTVIFIITQYRYIYPPKYKQTEAEIIGEYKVD